MTKRLTLLLTLLVLGISSVAFAQDKKITSAQLPATAQNFIKQHFKGATVTSAKLDKEMFDTDYETVLSNGVKINFDAQGNWDEIDCRSGVPAAVIPKSISSFLATNYKGQNVVQIDKKKAGYDIELSSGTEIEFDTNGKFLRIDD
ncbi:PepSY-like domain-containing protein [Flavobacterium hauense]